MACYTGAMKKFLLSLTFLVLLMLPTRAHGLSLVPCEDVIKTDGISLKQCECEQKQMLESWEKGNGQFNFEEIRKECSGQENNDSFAVGTTVAALIILSGLVYFRTKKTDRSVRSVRRSHRKK